VGVQLPGPDLCPGGAVAAGSRRGRGRARVGPGAGRPVCDAQRRSGLRSLSADPYFDPFWSRLNEAGASVAYHIGEFWYNEHIAPAWGLDPEPVFFEMSAWQWQHCWGERPIQETLSALVFGNLFGRFPNIHVVVSEFGAEWVPHFVRHMDKSRGMGRRGPWLGGKLKDRPSVVFQNHIRVCPYPEDDVVKIVTDLGQSDSIVMGSDFPHGEGMANPAEFADLLEALPEDDRDKILRRNALVLVGRA